MPVDYTRFLLRFEAEQAALQFDPKSQAKYPKGWILMRVKNSIGKPTRKQMERSYLLHVGVILMLAGKSKNRKARRKLQRKLQWLRGKF